MLHSGLGYQVSDNSGVESCIMTMHMTFQHFKELPKNFRFIADSYSAYPLATQQFFHKFGDAFNFTIMRVIGLTSNDTVSKKFHPYKQMSDSIVRIRLLIDNPSVLIASIVPTMILLFGLLITIF